MLPDRVSNPGPRLTSQVPYRLRYAARLYLCKFNGYNKLFACISLRSMDTISCLVVYTFKVNRRNTLFGCISFKFNGHNTLCGCISLRSIGSLNENVFIHFSFCPHSKSETILKGQYLYFLRGM